MINKNITELKKLVIEYTLHVESMLSGSLQGVFDRQSDPLKQIIEEAERAANIMDLSIEDMAINTIAKFQPVATNLRLIVGMLKMSNSLERIGDHCVNIAQSGLFLNEQPQLKPFIDLPKMKDSVMQMLCEASKALLELDSGAARAIYEMDDIVDNYQRAIKADLIGYMEKDAKNIRRSIELLNISGNLERIADLITNICEDIIYIKDGVVARHQGKKI
ncbi:MAG: phosphate signaling complex protein PhoU [Elusimicrobiota bacterium]|jgi:phosphate transport system protein|nr:phosphate signaling complex protein PhoU [Elusimicrobiota bacterium]